MLDKIWISLREIVVHPILFSLYPILFLFIHNRNELSPSVMYIPLFVSITLTLTTVFITYIFLKNLNKAGIITSFFLLQFFSFGHIHSNIKNIAVLKDHSFYTDGWIFLIVLIILSIILLVWIKRTTKSLHTATRFLNIVSIILIINILIPLAYEYRNLADIFEKKSDELTKSIETKVKAEEGYPDIYYIILDRYANNTTLQEEFGYDNTSFTNYLEQKGFFVSYKSYANYPKTHLSIASSLNMEHLTYLTEQVGKDNGDNTIAFNLVHDNKVVRFLKNHGYDFIYMGGWWGPTQRNKYADYNFNLYEGSNEFIRELLNTTALRPFIFSSQSQLKRENIVYEFQKLKQMPRFNNKPKFIYAHMLIPHYPYLFDRNCMSVKDVEGERENEHYLDQLICTNKMVRDTIDTILTTSYKHPVIIIQSDEGPFKFDEMRRSGEGVDWTTVSDKAKRVHMRILNAYYLPSKIGQDTSSLPDHNKTQLYDGISPVNTFRVVFNQYFDTKYKLLPDTSYFIPNLNFPYDFFEVTHKVRFNSIKKYNVK